jgi:hypothetical protein
MDNDKTKKLTALISKLTIAANKAVKQPEQTTESRTRFSITGLKASANVYETRSSFNSLNLLRN